MEKTLAFLKEAGTFFLATADGDQPRVRPFGIMLNLDGRLSFGTSNQKEVFKQINANPKIELCAALADGRFVRVSGTVFLNTTTETHKKFFEARPALAKLYAGRESTMVIFSFKTATATFQDMKGGNQTTVLY
jgi:uncharacterized pyridoxamine 5'-phosphate oxidase family protein